MIKNQNSAKFLSCLLMLLCFASDSFSQLGSHYDEELDNLLVSEPQKVFAISQKRLQASQKSGDKDKQLQALLYKALAQINLSQYATAKDTIEIGLSLAIKQKSTSYESEFYSLWSETYLIQGKFQLALENSQKAVELALTLKDDLFYAEKLIQRSYVYSTMNYNNLALKDVENALVIFKQKNDEVNIGTSYNLLAVINQQLKDYPQAIKYYLEALNYMEPEAEYDTSTAYYNLASAYFQNNEPDNAMRYYKLSKAIAIKINDESSIAFAEFGMAKLFQKSKKNTQALEEALKARAVFKKIKDEVMLFNCHLLLASLYTEKEEFSQAFALLSQAQAQSTILKINEKNKAFLTTKIHYYEAIADWQKAFATQNELLNVKEKIQQLNKKQSIQELQFKFNTKFDKEKYQLLQKQNQLQAKALQEERLRHYFMLGFLALAGLLLGLMYLGYRHQKKVKKKFYQLSITDPLTNVANRRYVLRKLRKILVGNNFKPFTLMMIDLDFFKKVNDKFGHDTGNEVLLHFAQSVQALLDKNSTIGRIGGEEWLIIMPEITAKESILNWLIKLRRNYATNKIKKIPVYFKLSFSSGIFVCNNNNTTTDELLKKVDEAMYQAKALGRGKDIWVV